VKFKIGDLITHRVVSKTTYLILSVEAIDEGYFPRTVVKLLSSSGAVFYDDARRVDSMMIKFGS
jgi:hypothetical protein